MAELFAELGSPVREAVAVLFSVMAEVGAVTVIENVALEPAAGAAAIADVIEQEIVPVAPTAGVLQLQPEGVTIELKVTVGGSVSVRTFAETAAVAWPRFCTVML